MSDGRPIFDRHIERGVYPLNWANGPFADWTLGKRAKKPMRRNTRVRYCALRGLKLEALGLLEKQKIGKGFAFTVPNDLRQRIEGFGAA